MYNQMCAQQLLEISEASDDAKGEMTILKFLYHWWNTCSTSLVQTFLFYSSQATSWCWIKLTKQHVIWEDDYVYKHNLSITTQCCMLGLYVEIGSTQPLFIVAFLSTTLYITTSGRVTLFSPKYTASSLCTTQCYSTQQTTIQRHATDTHTNQEMLHSSSSAVILVTGFGSWCALLCESPTSD